jgi:hypothetical protein
VRVLGDTDAVVGRPSNLVIYILAAQIIAGLFININYNIVQCYFCMFNVHVIVLFRF